MFLWFNFVSCLVKVCCVFLIICLLLYSKIICELVLCFVCDNKFVVINFGFVCLFVIINILEGFVGILIVMFGMVCVISCFVMVIKLFFGLKILFILGIDFVLYVIVVIVLVLLFFIMVLILYSFVVYKMVGLMVLLVFIGVVSIIVCVLFNCVSIFCMIIDDGNGVLLFGM